MEIRWSILVIIAGAAAVTFIPRVLPLMLLSRMALPDWIIRWLQYVPISVMAALIGQELFLEDGRWVPLTANIEWLAAVPAFAVAILTRSLLGTVITGVAAMMALRYFFPG
ncbi:AzlD domain-containing protein [Paenibacillus thailandensis]|uniref:AzlD domain-containing protein n=1 Tax=Paenibacillus thailandensis TaxID=393250 RepID=A0ABW5QYJ5_9BACL